MQRQQKCLLSTKSGLARIYILLGTGAGATLNTYIHNMQDTIPGPPDFKNAHLGLGLGLGAGAGGWGLGLGHELRSRPPCKNGSRSANRLASKYGRSAGSHKGLPVGDVPVAEEQPCAVGPQANLYSVGP